MQGHEKISQIYAENKKAGHMQGSFGDPDAFVRVYTGEKGEGFWGGSIYFDQPTDLFHLFYLNINANEFWRRHNHNQRDQTEKICKEIGHAVSGNMVDWQALGPVVAFDHDWWDSGGVAEADVIYHDGRYYMIYAGMIHGAGDTVCLATSDDLSQWTVHPDNPVFTPDPSWSTWDRGTYTRSTPHGVYRIGDEYYIYLTTQTRESAAIGAAKSKNLIDWEDLGPVMTMPYALTSPKHPECPHLVQRDGLFHLIYSHNGTNWIAVSDNPTEFHHTYPWMRALDARIFQINDRWFISSMAQQTMFDMFRPDRSGLYLAGIQWQGNVPLIRPLRQDDAD